jgi:hypothetical protein
LSELTYIDGTLVRDEETIAVSRDAIQDLCSWQAAQSDLAHFLSAMGKELANAHDGKSDSPSFSVTVEGKR